MKTATRFAVVDSNNTVLGVGFNAKHAAAEARKDCENLRALDIRFVPCSRDAFLRLSGGSYLRSEVVVGKTVTLKSEE